MIRTDVEWEGGGLYRTQCLECGCNFSTKRRDALYHDATCRKRANRRRKTIISDAQHCVETIRGLERMKRERYDLQDELHEALQMIRREMGIRTTPAVTDNRSSVDV